MRNGDKRWSSVRVLGISDNAEGLYIKVQYKHGAASETDISKKKKLKHSQRGDDSVFLRLQTH